MALFRDLRQRMPDRSPFEPDGIQRAFAVDIESFPLLLDIVYLKGQGYEGLPYNPPLV